MIEVRNLSKEYRIAKRDPGLRGAFRSLVSREYQTKRAVDNVSFTIGEGEMVGYIGANGAGKSTTIKMLCGILTPTSGQVFVNGIEPCRERRRNAEQIGAVFGQRTQLFWDIPVRESYELLRHIYKLSEKDYRETMDLFREVLDLDPLLDIPVRQLSLGQKMRCELGAAFLHNPSVVYLDEPTIGLDVSVKAKIRAFIHEMNRWRKSTVILTTHDMQDIEQLCSRVIMIDQGHVIYDDSLESVKKRFGRERVIFFELEVPETQIVLPPSIAARVNVMNPSSGEQSILGISFNPDVISASEVIASVLEYTPVKDLKITEPAIEEIVKDIYERGIVHEEVS